jgi:hypothetical protein
VPLFALGAPGQCPTNRPLNATTPTTKCNYSYKMDDESTTKCNYPDHSMHEIREIRNINDTQKQENRNRIWTLM